MLVLLIDDSKMTRRIVGLTLKQLGMEVSEADNGLEGLEQLRKGPRPDLVLVDWNMPEMNGPEFVAAVRADAAFAGLKLMMVTGEEDEAQHQAALAAGADEYVQKPLTKVVLVEKLKKLGLGQ